ncbi:DUF805 domain-containing protein [Flavobacteriaceae bacterium]|nr:DUF805 domain-containing protein [Flavobacteriaceae bacterium]MDC1274025.1 DUF805 domain-containing protein [Flavobacteriaceae bacterium]
MKKYYLEILTNKYSDFNGRARRKEYWMWTLYYTIILLFAMVLDNALGLNFELMGQDLGYGWIYLIILIPLIGFIWILVLFCTDGVKEDNKWGSNPKSVN